MLPVALKTRRQLLTMLLRINHNNTEARSLANRIKESSFKNKIGLSYDYVYFDKQFADPRISPVSIIPVQQELVLYQAGLISPTVLKKTGFNMNWKRIHVYPIPFIRM